MNIVELIAADEEQSSSPCKYGTIVECHACYCHHNSEDAPRKCPIWRNYGISDLSKWRNNPWQPDDYHLRRLVYRKTGRKQYKIEISELGKTWPDEGCPLFESNAEFK